MRFVIEGGLGNQILQYAYFLNISKVRSSKSPCNLDISWFGANVGVNRRFRLFEVLPKPKWIELISISSSADRVRYLAFRVARQIDRKLNYPIMQHLFWYADSSLWTRIENLSAEIESLQYQFKQTHGDNEIRRVAVHLRFGDYLTEQDYNVIDYNELLNLCIKEYDNTVIDIFTDDKKLAQDYVKRLKLQDRYRFVEEDDEVLSFIKIARYEVLFCSNSTFSYAAALIGLCKVIYKPKSWKKDTPLPIVKLGNKRFVEY